MSYFTRFLFLQIFGKKKYFPFVLWGFNISVLICNRVFEGYRFSSIGWVICFLLAGCFSSYNMLSNSLVWYFGKTIALFSFSTWSWLCFLLMPRQHWAYLDNFRGTFRWHICFNFGIFFASFILWNFSGIVFVRFSPYGRELLSSYGFAHSSAIICH